MKFHELDIVGAHVIDLEPHADERGFFARARCSVELEAHGLPGHFPQANISRNDRAGTLRGMHVNTDDFPEAKVVRCTRGRLYDVIVDLRADSPTLYRWVGVELDDRSGRAVYVPAGCAHGFVTLVDDTDVWYEMSAAYQPSAARGIRWDDPFFGIVWPRTPTVIADRDAQYPPFDPSTPPNRP